jgi:cellulose synthase/poly-beta-1,6-N-acetylglucosamine synthase-like glycosyltransferase
MTFEVYQNGLGKVGFTLGAVAVTQDPDNFRDYVRQTKRWALGLWQTVRRHSPRLNLFTAMLALSLTELITSSLLFITLPVLVLILLVPDLVSTAVTWPGYGTAYAYLSAHMTLIRIFYGVIVPDLAMTVLVAAVERRPRLLLSAVFFPFLRVLDAAIGLWAIPTAWLAKSDGVWRSPTRRGALRSGKHSQVRVGPPPVAGLTDSPEPTYAPDRVAFAEAEGHHSSG